jgi:menaquinone-specific isochorismate synthase
LPVETALGFIEAAEPVGRGWYAGAVGWFDGEGDGELAVALRSAVSDGSRTRLYAGAGIVAGSDPDREWQETELKFLPMMEALGCVPGG